MGNQFQPVSQRAGSDPGIRGRHRLIATLEAYLCPPVAYRRVRMDDEITAQYRIQSGKSGRSPIGHQCPFTQFTFCHKRHGQRVAGNMRSVKGRNWVRLRKNETMFVSSKRMATAQFPS